MVKKDPLKNYRILALETKRIDVLLVKRKKEFQDLKGEIFSLIKQSKQLHTSLVDQLIE